MHPARFYGWGLILAGWWGRNVALIELFNANHEVFKMAKSKDKGSRRDTPKQPKAIKRKGGLPPHEMRKLMGATGEVSDGRR